MSFVSAADGLTKEDVERFSRQMMVEGIGAKGMKAIRQARVVCIGLGGLGSTIALYLAAAGVGELVFVDHDEVDVSNLHRQVIHTTDRVGVKKVESARESCLRLFPETQITTVDEGVCFSNIEAIVAQCDVVVDGTDNVASRYLINDAAMRCGKPLVSGSAMRWEGQLSVYGYKGGPCYRCLFPVPPPAAAVGSCNDTGVIGPLPGMIGCLQALETLKVITGAGETLSGRLFIFDGLRFTARVVKLRGKQPHCRACGGTTATTLQPQKEYEGDCCLVGVAYSSKVLPLASQRCTPTAFAAARDENCALLRALLGQVSETSSEGALAHVMATRLPHWSLTVDVRVAIQYGMAHLPFSINIPLPALQQQLAPGAGASAEKETVQHAFLELIGQHVKANVVAHLVGMHVLSPSGIEKAVEELQLPLQCTLHFVCRRGVASAQATQLFFDVFSSTHEENAGNYALFAINVDGGLNAYHHQVDKGFPYY